MSVLSVFQSQEGKYMVILQFWMKPWARKKGLRYTTIMLLFLVHELKRPVRKEEWKQLMSTYSFGYGSADVMLLENKGYLRKVMVKLDDLDKVEKMRRDGVGVKKIVSASVESYRYVITKAGEEFAEKVKREIGYRMNNFEMRVIRSMREFT